MVGFGIIAIIAAATLYLVMPFSTVGEPMLVDSAELPDGRCLKIVQEYTGTMEPYLVSLFVKSTQGSYSEYYIDHESLYWRGEIVLDLEADIANVYNRGDIVARYELKEDAFFRKADSGYKKVAALNRSRIEWPRE